MISNNRAKRILVVDDDICIRELSSAALIAKGYQVDTAEDGEQGWNILAYLNNSDRNGYDLLITDNNMPKLSGLDLIRKLRSEGISLPVILASGNMPVNAEKLGLAAIMPKPFMPDELAEMAQCILGGERANN